MTGINRKGIDARRRILHPGVGFDQEIDDLRRTIPLSVFYRAVVVEFLNDLSRLTDERLSELKKQVVNPEFLEIAPRNSAIVRIISNARDRKNSSPIVCYPFLPPYLSLPAKPGEQVWVMFENESISTELGYWLWRVSEPRHVDDLNYTHGDRKFDKSSEQSTSDRAAGKTTVIPGFQNGGGTYASWSLSGENDYETIVEESEAYEDVTLEAVPRFTKRPGDTVLQGSNNTLIVLGEDRVGSSIKKDEEKKEAAGAIDIVVGRGRFQSEPGEDPEGTAPRTIKNARGNVETDKNPIASGASENDAEGDPDLINDAARILVVMKSNADTNLGLNGNYPEAFDTDADSADGSSFVVAKGDEIRIIARKDDDKGINGSIRIVKEGTVGEDQAAILMLSDGTVRVDGKVIYIGRPGGDGPGKNGAEPYIKFSKYKSQMEELIEIMRDLMTVFMSTFLIPDPPIVGGPSPSLTAALTNENGVSDTIVKLEALKERLDEAQSERIFGE